MVKSIIKPYNKVAVPVLLTASLLAGSVALDDVFGPPGESLLDDFHMWSMNRLNGNACVFTGLYKDSFTARQKGLYEIYEKAARTEIGAGVMQDMKESETMLCFDNDLKHSHDNGFTVSGAYYLGANMLTINPDIRMRSSHETTLVHEGRHHQQYSVMGLQDPYSDGNYSEDEILIRHWLLEADAFLVEVLHARERYLEGDMESLRAMSMNGRKMGFMLETTLQQTGDTEEAMRAAIWAFRDNEALASAYDKRQVAILDRKGYTFDPDREADQLLTDEDLMKIGNMGAYGNYMNEEFIERIRQSITMDDYRALREQLELKKEQAAPTLSSPVKRPPCRMCV